VHTQVRKDIRVKSRSEWTQIHVNPNYVMEHIVSRNGQDTELSVIATKESNTEIKLKH